MSATAYAIGAAAFSVAIVTVGSAVGVTPVPDAVGDDDGDSDPAAVVAFATGRVVPRPSAVRTADAGEPCKFTHEMDTARYLTVPASCGASC